MWTGLLFRIAKHWIAGDKLEDAISRAQESLPYKVFGMINLLGEDTTSKEETEATTAEYLEILQQLHSLKIPGCISLKPTQLGLSIDENLYRGNLEKILSNAKSLNSYVWVDMESHQYTTATVDSYIEMRKRFDSVGVAIQAYLKRSEEDVTRILDSKGMIRLCKGAYNEPPSIAYKNRRRINENYSKLMRIMFERGRGFAVATHDEKLLREAIGLSNGDHADFEFEMLMGIRDMKKKELVAQGYRVSEYIPYGKSWWAYSKRRITEHKSNVLLLTRSLISG
jgi:proline dehydrogenase